MPPGRQRNIRKRKEVSDSDKEEEQDEDAALSVRERVEAAKLLQRQRARPTGMDAAALAIQKDSLSSALERTVAAPPKNDMLDSFSKEQVRESDVELDPNMQKYIDEQMERRLGVRKEDERQRGGPMDPEQQLYVTPDELRIDPIKPEDVAGSWLTGIAEVALPAHFKLKNIEETEAVKKRMLQPDADSDEDVSEDAGDNKLPRGAFPRGFGREGDKVREVRTHNLLKKAGKRSRR